MSEICCMDCIVGDFKDSLCEKEFCEKFKCAGDGKDFIQHVLEVARPHGEWKADGTCSECGVYSSLNKDATYFCPNCGADMRKEG